LDQRRGADPDHGEAQPRRIGGEATAALKGIAMRRVHPEGCEDRASDRKQRQNGERHDNAVAWKSLDDPTRQQHHDEHAEAVSDARPARNLGASDFCQRQGVGERGHRS
jgi:hypothetical protein